MKSKHLRNYSKVTFLKVAIYFFLTCALIACGENTAAPTQTHTSNKVSTPTQTHTASTVPSTPNTSLSLNSASINVNVGNLLIQSSSGFQCPSVLGSAAVPGQLVFASDRTTYTQAEIAQMRTYIKNNIIDSKAGISSPPPTLRWVLGGSMNKLPGTPSPFANCGVIVTLTNTGNTPIQIPKVGVELQASPQQNAYKYHLINVCSAIPVDANAVYTGCPPTTGGGGACNYYDASIQLGLGEKNTVFSAVPHATNGMTRADCGTLTIAPAAQDRLHIAFSLAPNISQNLLYSIVPVFTLDTNQGQQTLALSQLESTLAFASVGQFSCYGLQGTTFVQEQSPFSGPTWCL